MADYLSYKKIQGDQLDDGILSAAKFSTSPTSTFGVKWFYGTMCRCSGGCCCLWTVPTGVKKLWIQAWGSGGNGAGSCSCRRCQHYRGAGGGFYNSVMIDTTAGCQYRVCAGGVYPCLSRECCGCIGCASYVNGHNLSNFCAYGGSCGHANDSWAEACNATWHCCVGPTSNGGQFGMGNLRDTWSSAGYSTNRSRWCHCYNQMTNPTAAPFIGTEVIQSLRECWIRCGCWIVPYGHGGQNAMTNYCERCCGQGGTGGGGLVKITYF